MPRCPKTSKKVNILKLGGCCAKSSDFVQRTTNNIRIFEKTSGKLSPVFIM